MRGTDAVTGTHRTLASAALGAWLALAALAPAGAQTPERTVLVADVQVTGNQSMATSMILANMKTRPGRPINLAELQEDVRRLTGLGAFRDVKVVPHNTTDGRVVVEVVVQEHPNVIGEVVIKGDRHLNLDKVAGLQRIRRGATLNPTWNQQAANEIQEYYRSKGYLFAEATVEEGLKMTDRRVVINITEGPKVRVRGISFTGNESLASDSRLRTQVQTKALLGPIGFGDTYNPQMIEYDIQKLEAYYHENGYLDARVSRELKFTPDLEYVDVVYHIHEGVRYRVHDVTVRGVKNLPEGQVTSVVQAKKGEPYNEGVIKADLNNIQDVYGWRGYKVAANKELFSPEPGLVHVQYQVIDEPRPPARVGEIKIIGNDVTKDRVIRRALGIYPGQVLRYPELRRAEQMLARLNIFEVNPQSGVRPTVTEIDDPAGDGDVKDVLVQVKETYTGSLMFGLGVNSNAGLVGSIVLNERNFDLFRPPTSLADVFEGRAFRGGGQEFRLEAIPGTQLQRYTASLREPFLFDLPISLTNAAYYYNRIFLEYTERRVGGRFTLGHQFDPVWSLAGGLRIEGVNVDDVPFYAPVDYTSVAGENFVIAPRAAVVRDTRDSYLRPTEGSRTEASYEHVLGSFNFPVLNLEGSKYFTTWQRRDGSGKHVLAMRSQVSWAAADIQDVPVFERFFAGGYQSIRGFSFRGVGPQDPATAFKVGGNFMLLASLEYQVPVLANDQLYLVAFLDTGTVEQSVEITNYRMAAGFGARIAVPMMGPVPIALDFGFPITKSPYDNEQVFAFYLGVFR